MTMQNVLASRYAGADLAAIWSPEHKIVLERRLWIAVLRAQRDLGIEVPQAAIDAVIAKHAVVRQLLDNGWLHLWRFHKSGFLRYAQGAWSPLLLTNA